MATIASDLTDLLDFLRGHRAPMGVARVQMALLEAGIAADAPALFAPIAFHAPSARFRELPIGALRRFLGTTRLGGTTDEPAWLASRAALDAAHAAAPEAAPPAGTWLFNSAPPVHVPGQMRRLREFARARGLRLGVLVHDTIPLVVPEHCPPELVEEFAHNFVTLCVQTDRVVATSGAAARDFALWQRKLLPGVDIPVGQMPLDAPLPALAGGVTPPLPAPLGDGRPYVLCVSTIEARKHQSLLLHAWITLLRRHGEAAVPRLVLVGREGYGAAEALRLLSHAPELRRNAVWLRDVGDALLSRLYRDCLFAVFNSFYEGWGLPVTEALSHGKLVLAPDHSSLREAGGEGALYFTANSEPSLVELAWGLIADPARRAALEASLPERLQLRSWRAVAEGLVQELAVSLPPLPRPLARIGPVLGRRLSLMRKEPGTDDVLPDPLEVAGEFALEGEAWDAAGPEGVWLGEGAAALRLPLPEAAAGRALTLLLEVAAPPLPVRVPLRALRDGDAGGLQAVTLAATLAADQRAVIALTLPPGGAGEVVLEFDTTQAVGTAAGPRRCLRLEAVTLRAQGARVPPA